MVGTIINVAAILTGTIVGLVLGAKFPEKLRNTLTAAIGIFTALLGVNMFLKSENNVISLVGIVIGICLGEWWNLESKIESLGGWLQTAVQNVFSKEQSDSRERFIQAFVTATLLFGIGPMSILGSIQDGLSGDYSMLAIKSILDGVTAIVFASALGYGVAFSAIPIFLYQGGISLLAVKAQLFMTEPMINEMTATGGVLLCAISLSNMLGIKKIRVASMIPALLITPLIVWLLTLF